MGVVGYQMLANAIVIQAAKDYRRQVKAGKVAKELERFFKSTWFKELTSIDPEYITRRIKEEAWK